MDNLIDYSDVSPREFGLAICANLKAQLGVDLAPILASVTLDNGAKRRIARQALAEAIIDRAYRLGFPDFAADAIDPAENEETRRLLGLDGSKGPDTEPNFCVTGHNAAVIADYQGGDVKTYVYNMAKRFENMAVASGIGTLVAEMAGGAIVSVGVPAGIATIKALRAGKTLLVAMRTGITSIGMKTVILAVAAVLVALLLYLMLENPKKILGVVFNNTDDDLIVRRWRESGGDLHMEHGEMADFMEDHDSGDLDSPWVQIKERLYFGEADTDNVVWAGVYFADRNFGFRGAEGVAVLSSTTTDLSVAHMFAVPYTNDNGTNMRYLTSRPSDLGKLYRELYESRKSRVDFADHGYRLTSTVNDPRGGVVGCIASINKTV